MPSTVPQRALIRAKLLDYETRRDLNVAATRASILAAGITAAQLHDLKTADAVDAVHHCP